MEHSDKRPEPWYRNPWVWLIIAIPSLTVLGCALTIYLAVSNPEIILEQHGVVRPAGTTVPADYGLG